jgi:hypothetical protein
LLRDSSGRVFLNSAGGGVEAINIQPATADDTFEVGTVSGDIQLDRVSNPKVMAKTVNGTLTMSGPLAKQGYYGFSNVTGDTVLVMPHDASFQLKATVSEKNNIVSDFNLKFINERTPAMPLPAPKPTPNVLRRVTGICGGGDATISVASFGGTVRLRKL